MCVIWLLLLASVVPAVTAGEASCPDDEVAMLQSTGGKPLALVNDETEGEPLPLVQGGKADGKACKTLYDPAAMAKISADAAAAATLKKTAAIAAAGKECEHAKKRAELLKANALKAATNEQAAADLAAAKLQTSMVAKAEAEVAGNKTKVMTQINNKRQDQMATATRETKREMDDIQRKFEHDNLIYKTTADHSVSTAKNSAHAAYMSKINSQLAATKTAFQTATNKHKTKRTDIIATYNKDKTHAAAAAKARGDEIRRQAAKKHLADVRLARAEKTRKVEKATKVAAADTAAAEAKKSKDLADAENDSKVAEMGEWVSGMVTQFEGANSDFCGY